MKHIIILHCILLISCSPGLQVINLEDDSDIPLIIYSSIEYENNYNSKYDKGDIVLIPDCCILGEIPLKVDFHIITYDNNTKECSVEGIVSCEQTGEYFPGIHIIFAEQLQITDSGKVVKVEKSFVIKGFDGKFILKGILYDNSFLYFSVLGYTTSEYDLVSFINLNDHRIQSAP